LNYSPAGGPNQFENTFFIHAFCSLRGSKMPG